jgi:hypothetical protein
MGKLKGILHERYGMGLQVRFLQEVSALSFEDDGILRAGGDLHVPIQVDDKLLATAVLEKGGELQVVEQETASQLIRLFLEPELFNWYVHQMTHNLKIAATQEEVPSIYESTDLGGFLDSENEPGSTMMASTNVICLESPNPHLIPRMSLSIHEISERWAFLNYSDIQDHLQTVQDLKSLGTLTLVIDDVLRLSPARQQVLFDYLNVSTPAEEPLVVVGCTSSIEQLERQQIIHPGLARILKAHRLEVERLPRDPKLLQESLEIMLEF